MRRRRALSFASLADVTPDVERLLAGHVTVGRWSLGQICNHLALTINAPIDGCPVKFPWLVRRTFGAAARRLMFRWGWIPRGVRVPRTYLPRPGLDAAAEAEALRAAVGRFQIHVGPLDEHPLLGPMGKAGWERFHLLHCAHHLSFAIPGHGM